MSEFYIKKGSLNPILRVEAIQTGRNKPFLHFYEILQDSEIFFSMRNLNTGIVKVANAKCYIKRADDDSCEEKYLICYNWKKYDYDYRQKSNLFNLDSLYRKMPKKSFIKGRKQEFEILFMYYWLHDMEGDDEGYWQGYLEKVLLSIKKEY